MACTSTIPTGSTCRSLFKDEGSKIRARYAARHRRSNVSTGMKTDRMEGTMMTSITRRRVLRGAIAVAAGAFANRAVLTPIRVFAQARAGASAEGVKALVYDVFGTCT